MSDKDKVIRHIYYDTDKGFGSINDTYKQAHHILNTITVNDVKELLNKQNQDKLNHIGDLTAMWQKNHCKRYK